ncbi:MAG: PhoH family protein [Planctomycetota bacterium]
MAEATLQDIPQDEAIALFGQRDENLRLLRDELGIRVIARSGTIHLQGTEDQVNAGLGVLEKMRAQVRAKRELSADDIRRFLGKGASKPDSAATEPGDGKDQRAVEISGPLRKMRARSDGQNRYVKAIRGHDLTFCIGPAGTGKTYLAVATALEAFDRHQIKRIVLVRPAVEAGEKLGYLPGDLQAKVHPFLRPLLDALRDMLDYHQVRSYLENDIVEIAPLAYMRGRTLNDSFIILDEGQNTTVPQMRMFLTRMGMGSKVVVTGDITQVDLPPGTPNGLEDAVVRLESLTSVEVVRMRQSDIVRHPLVQEIVNAYELS